MAAGHAEASGLDCTDPDKDKMYSQPDYRRKMIRAKGLKGL